jgi:hypothetical protein
MIGGMGVVFGLAIMVAALVAGIAVRVLRRDEVFDGITPGLLPAPGQPVVRRHLRRGEQPVVAVRFNPPDGVGPGLAGVAIDGRVDPVELSATLIDLAARGWLKLHPLTRAPGAKPYDWQLMQVDPAPDEPLSTSEQQLLSAAFDNGPQISLSSFRSQPQVKAAAQTLLAEAEERQWLNVLPSGANWLAHTAGPAMALLGLLALFVFNLGFIGIGLLLGGGIFFLTTRNLPESLSAEGYAVRAQCEGFKQYLATAEAEQLRFEVGVDVFSRYLPYAMVFGVVDHWRSVFAEALQAEPDADLDSLNWLLLDDALQTVILFDLLSDSGIFESLTTDFADFADLPGIDGLVDSVSDAFDGFDLSDFTD